MFVLCVVSKDKKAKRRTIKTKKQVRIKYKTKYKRIQKKIPMGLLEFSIDLIFPAAL